MRLHSNNEWDRLTAAVVGTVDGFCPGLEISGTHPVDVDWAVELARKAYPQWYLDEVAEDLEDLCEILRRAGAAVLRPKWSETTSQFTTPNWSAVGFDIYNVRDLHIVFGNTLIVSATSSRYRLFDTYAFHRVFYDTFFEEGFRWISAPVPRLKGEYLHEIQRSRSPLESVEDGLHQRLSHGLSERFHCLDEEEVVFDAANIIRLGQDIVFLVSSTGNHKAARWLKHVLGPDYHVHVTQAYRSSHLDSTILPLRPGVVLLNGARVSESSCPRLFDGWEKLYFMEVAPLPEAEAAFHQTVRLPIYAKLREKGVDSTLSDISSPWAGLNVLSIDPNTVLVHDRQTALIHALEAKRFTVVPVRMRHCYTMLGGLHCTTLDVVRDSR